MKRYDRAYFDKWYRDERVNAPAEVRRKVVLAVGVAEYFLQRSIRSVLDVGCGEGQWLLHLRAMRPRVRYLGLDSSSYVVRQFGKARNIRRASFGELPSLHLTQKFDLVICSDVLHYVEEAEIRDGLREIVRLCDGIAFLEALTKEDDIIGDLDGLISRPAAWYRKTFERAGLVHIAPYTWLGKALQPIASSLETV
ncbi:MAG TPA: class I SAM-dependent methyltransferase [Gemmatimonadaceae bacterium]|jgi:SAM-dependent methyltransferase|nr:class I SAM-dependent methyltransferase [Gemmatimonadaceae bacterium]